MFKWRNKSSKISLEPKTPRLQSIPLLPDPLYAPISYHQPYDPPLNYPQAAPMADPWYTHAGPTSRKSRSRTVSTPSVKGIFGCPPLVFFSFWPICEAPTPNPSQGRFISNVDHLNRMARSNSIQAHPVPVAGMNLSPFHWFKLISFFFL